jgi:hypothetical protein
MYSAGRLAHRFWLHGWISIAPRRQVGRCARYGGLAIAVVEPLAAVFHLTNRGHALNEAKVI